MDLLLVVVGEGSVFFSVIATATPHGARWDDPYWEEPIVSPERIKELWQRVVRRSH